MNAQCFPNAPLVLLPYSHGMYDPRPTFDWVVGRVTPSGKFTAQRTAVGAGGELAVETRFFDARGNELGESLSGQRKQFGHTASFDVDAWKQRVARREASQKAAAAINAVAGQEKARDAWSKESMAQVVAEMEQRLAVARALVEAI